MSYRDYRRLVHRACEVVAAIDLEIFPKLCYRLLHCRTRCFKVADLSGTRAAPC